MGDITSPPPPAIPAGWYNDDQGRMRWWDGGQWTDAFAPLVAAPVVPVVPWSGISVTGFVLACVALLAGLAMVGILGLLAGVFGLIVSIAGYADRKRRGRGLAIAGIIMSASAIALGIFGIVLHFT